MMPRCGWMFRARCTVGLCVLLLLGGTLKRAQAGDGAAFAESPVETGATSESLAILDSLMRSFITENEIPGGALAVAKNGRLLYARGFGLADREQGEPVRPDALFRIASISKPITAVTLLRLVDQGQITLDAPVFQLLPHRPGLEAATSPAAGLEAITLRQVLQHRGGWDRDRSLDPMFATVEIGASLGIANPARPDDLVSFMMSWPLDFAPGSRYAYSNFGYCLLGRVIEQVSGTGYESYVQREVLRPLGIHRMRIGHSLAEERVEGEVCYYTPRPETGMAVVGTPAGRPVPRPYGTWCLETMDAHGGWLGSAIDLVRFGSLLQINRNPGLLSPEMHAAMHQPPDWEKDEEGDGSRQEPYYALGWQVRQVGEAGRCNLWHTGALPGVSTLLVLRHDGFCWAALFNTSFTSNGRRPADEIDGRIHAAVDKVPHWPEHDLFPDYVD